LVLDHSAEVNFGADRTSVNDDVCDNGVYGDGVGDNTVVPIVLSKMV
jgi:hypothetical protein